jgi:hypothetical protein
VRNPQLPRQFGRQEAGTQPGQRADFVRFRDDRAGAFVVGEETVDSGQLQAGWAKGSASCRLS